MKLKKILPWYYGIMPLLLIIALPGVLSELFPSSELLIGIKETMKPYILYIVLPLSVILWLFLVICMGRSDTSIGIQKITDIIRIGLIFLLPGFGAVLFTMILHLILSKYVTSYSADFDSSTITIFLICRILIVLAFCAYQYGKLLKKRKKGNDGENILDLIKKGESLTLEFKQTFFQDVKTKKEADYIRKESLKNIAGFLNKDGGTLLIGIYDNGKIYGIENDNYKSDDDYLKRFKDIVKTNFIPGVLNLIHYEIITVDNKKILRVDCPRSDKLIFIKGEPDWAYVRTNPAVEKISGAALVDYAKIREKENEKK